MGDPVAPTSRLGIEPCRDGCSAASRHHIHQPARIEIDDPGHQSGGRCGGRRQKRGLVDADRRRRSQPGEVIDTRRAVISNRSHRRMPAHPEVPGRLSHAVTLRADPASDLGSSPLSQHRPRSDLIRLLGPRAHPTVGLCASPAPLAPHHHRRPPRHRQIPHDHGPPAMTDRPATAALTAHRRLGGLHQDPPLAIDKLLGQDHEAVQTHQRSRASTTVNTHQGPPPLVASSQSQQ